MWYVITHKYVLMLLHYFPHFAHWHKGIHHQIQWRPLLLLAVREWVAKAKHYNDVTMTATASLITSLTIVCSTVYSSADQRKHQSSASLAFVRGIHRRPVNSPHKWPVTRKMSPFDDVIMKVSSDVTNGRLLRNNMEARCRGIPPCWLSKWFWTSRISRIELSSSGRPPEFTSWSARPKLLVETLKYRLFPL